MTTIETRTTKGAPLSWAEADANFTNLNTDKLEATDRPYSDTNPIMDSTAAQGTSPKISRQDHVHPSDTSKVNKSGDTMTGTLKTTKVQFGVSGTTANNFVCDPSADDGSMKLTRESGTDVMTVNSAGRVVFPSNAQVWYDQTVSRATGVTYTNNTVLPIHISILLTSAGSLSIGIELLVDGVVVWNMYDGSARASAIGFTIVGVVPPGKTYFVNNFGGAISLVKWYELRY